MKSKQFKKRPAVCFGIVLGLALVLIGPGTGNANFLFPQVHHPGEFFEKYALGSELPYFDGVRVDGTDPVSVNYEEFRQFVLPDTFYLGGGPNNLPAALPPYDAGTLVWGYDVDGSGSEPPIWPGITIEAQKTIPTTVTYVNILPISSDLQTHVFSIDQTIHWANPLEVPGPPQSRLELPPYSGPQPVVSHLHGGEVPSAFDGAPDQWFTSNDIRGPGYRTSVAGDIAAGDRATYVYPNEQEATTLWVHDHTLGITRINVYAGVAAYYFLRDTFDTGNETTGLGLPSGAYEVEFVIQDRMFDILGNLLFPDGLPFFVPNAQHPFWNPEFLGDVMTVNGRSWPVLTVKQRRYRIRLLNGSNARFYNLSLAATGRGKKVKAPPFWVIGTDGGLLDTAVMTNEILIAPGERYDVIVDFTGIDAGTAFILGNDAKAPYPFGATADPQTVGQIAQFVVGAPPAVPDPSVDIANSSTLRAGTALVPVAGFPPKIVPLPGTPLGDAIAVGVNVQKVRQLTLNETPGPFGPLDAMLNNTRWGGVRDDGTATSAEGLTLDTGTVADVTNYLTELPQVGSTEVWEIINLTGDAHPIHLHLVQFQVLNRQGFNVRKYEREYLRRFPGGAAANPNSGIFIPHFGPPMLYDNSTNPDFCETAPGTPCDGVGGHDPKPTTLGGNPDITNFLSKSPIAPAPYEEGWKDTVIALPKQVTRIVVRWTPQNIAVGDETPGTNQFVGFDPTDVGNPIDGTVGSDGGLGPGYVWHCHILDHEDNEMMRPYVPVTNPDNTL